jgi:phage terminase large subunit-like protein
MNWAKFLNPNELDPVIMARNAGIELDPWQSKLVRSKSSKILVNCSRQTGKSTTVSVLADHTAFYKSESTILLLSPSLRQSGELFRKCLDVYQDLGKPIPADSENKLSLTLDGGSRIVSLPGKEGTVRGFSAVDLLIIDEASRVPEELYAAVTPMLAVSNGRLVLLSTPFGTRGFFYEAYKNKHRWEYYEVPATECPRISKEFLDNEREERGDWWFQQEFMCKFMDSQTSAFRSEDIEQIVKPGLEVWDI